MKPRGLSQNPLAPALNVPPRRINETVVARIQGDRKFARALQAEPPTRRRSSAHAATAWLAICRLPAQNDR